MRQRCAPNAAALAVGGRLGRVAAAAGEVPIAGDAAQALDGLAWSAVSSSGRRVQAQLPGDLISDLARAGVIADPWKDLTWREHAGLWDTHSWNFTVSFPTPAWASIGATLVVFDSVKMAGDITLNGVALGAATSQHLRYTYDISKQLAAPSAAAANSLTVSFPPTVTDTRNNPGRYPACSGGWDWVPYSNETTGRTPNGIRTMSKGLVKSVYLTHVRQFFITAVKPLVVYLGSYPKEPLTDARAGGWRVDVMVYLRAPAAGMPTAVGGTLRVTSAWGGELSVPVSGLAAGVETAVNVSLAVKPGAIRLWWPNTVSSIRPLHAINVSFTSSAGEPAVVASSRVGFRTLALATADDSDPVKLAGVPSSGALTMRIKIICPRAGRTGSRFTRLQWVEAATALNKRKCSTSKYTGNPHHNWIPRGGSERCLWLDQRHARLVLPRATAGGRRGGVLQAVRGNAKLRDRKLCCEEGLPAHGASFLTDIATPFGRALPPVQRQPTDASSRPRWCRTTRPM